MFQNKLKSENSIRYFNSISLHSNLNDFCICYLNSNLRCDLEFKRFFHSILNVTHCPFRCRVGYLFVFLLCFLLYSFFIIVWWIRSTIFACSTSEGHTMHTSLSFPLFFFVLVCAQVHREQSNQLLKHSSTNNHSNYNTNLHSLMGSR